MRLANVGAPDQARRIFGSLLRWCLEAIWVRGEVEIGGFDGHLKEQWLSLGDMPAVKTPTTARTCR